MTDLSTTQQQRAQLAQRLNIKAIQCAERDTQVFSHSKQRNEFVNTWSVDGFAGEGCQLSEPGWGTHEQYFPIDGDHHDYGCDAANLSQTFRHYDTCTRVDTAGGQLSCFSYNP